MSFTIATVNVNGLRAAARKGMGDWLADTAADLRTLQEARAPEQLAGGLNRAGWETVSEASLLKGRAGVAVAVRAEREDADVAASRRGLPGVEGDTHTGRWLETDLADPLG